MDLVSPNLEATDSLNVPTTVKVLTINRLGFNALSGPPSFPTLNLFHGTRLNHVHCDIDLSSSSRRSALKIVEGVSLIIQSPPTK